MSDRKENEISCWTVAVGNFKGPFGSRKQQKMEKQILDLLKKQDGFVGIHPVPPNGTLLLFDSEYNAISARNGLRYHGVQCGTNICEVYVDTSCFLQKKGERKR